MSNKQESRLGKGLSALLGELATNAPERKPERTQGVNVKRTREVNTERTNGRETVYISQ